MPAPCKDDAGCRDELGLQERVANRYDIVDVDQMLLNDSLLVECRRFGSWRLQRVKGC